MPPTFKLPFLLNAYPHQMKSLTNKSLHINPFSRDIIDSDIEDANEKSNIIESDEEIDEI